MSSLGATCHIKSDLRAPLKITKILTKDSEFDKIMLPPIVRKENYDETCIK